MSADLESIIAAALTTHWALTMCSEGDGFYIECRCGEVGHVESDAEDREPANQWSAAHQARAVLDALTEAGGVEYAVVVDNLSYKFQSPELGVAKEFASIHEGQLNSRLKAGPWTAAEG